MSIAAPPSFDKAIRAQRTSARREELARLLAAARERMSSYDGLPPRFEYALLHRHVAALSKARLGLLIIGFGMAPLLWKEGGAPTAAAWSVAVLAALFAHTMIVSRFQVVEDRPIKVNRWTQGFLAAHILGGLPWAVLAVVPPSGLHSLILELPRFLVLLSVMAAAALSLPALRAVIPAAFLPMACGLGYRLAAGTAPGTEAMDTTLLAAIPLFAVVAAKLREGAISALRFQTERDQLIAELETARTYSDEARRRAEEANKAKSRFLATMSHELRTPLNAILGFSEVITNEILGPIGNGTYKEYVQDINNSGQHLLNLINEILDLSRVEAGRYSLNEEAVDLVAVARECTGYIQMRADAKAITITSQFEEKLPQLWGDPRALRQVVLNLLSNAVKFTPPNGKILLRVGWTAGGGQYVSVRDNGPGVPDDEIATVLSPFGQGSSAIKSAEQGTGLGLPIVQALVRLHDGEFEFRSKLREGTEAIAIFPHARVLEVMPAVSELA